MSRLRKSTARGENIGWVSRKDSNNMDRVVGAGVTSIYFPWCSPESSSPWTLRRTFSFFFFSSVNHALLEKASKGFFFLGFPDDSDGKESSCDVRDLGSIPGLGRSPGEGKGYPLQYSSLENPMDRGAWWATVHGVAKSQT